MSASCHSLASGEVCAHRLRTVERDQVILPSQTLQLLERNVVQFVKQREQLAKFNQPTKQKGLLFYGPPGTAKFWSILTRRKETKASPTRLTETGKLSPTGVVTTTLRTPTSTLITMQRKRNHSMTIAAYHCRLFSAVQFFAVGRKQMGFACDSWSRNTKISTRDTA